MTTTTDTDADVDLGELVEADDEEGFVDLTVLRDWGPPAFEDICTLNRSISGCASAKGLPFTLTIPFPAWTTHISFE